MSIDAPCLYLGSFNAEQFWRQSNVAKLPVITDSQADTIVSVMDELEFVFCNSSYDLLITRLPMNDVHKQYLWSLGFCFANNELPLLNIESFMPSLTKLGLREDGNVEALKPTSICQLLLETTEPEYFQTLISPLSRLSPYSIEPLTEKLCNYYALESINLELEVVKKVNSKIFSHQLSKELFDNTVGEIVYSASDLERVGLRLLECSPFLIKDEFGVSGKGNILVSSPQILKRIVKYILKQEHNGKITRFLLEPLLDKKIDFSCQFEIDQTGQFQICSIQTMQNAGFAFSSIQTAAPSFQEYLESNDYFSQVEAIATKLYQVGYYGSVCLDSMVLKDGKIIPIVEINARKSMGFINDRVDRFLRQFSLQGALTFFSLTYSNPVSFLDILERMEQKNILFLKDKSEGILPLSANTLDINHKLSCSENQKMHKGRLYVSVISKSQDSKTAILNKMDDIFTQLEMKIFTN